MPTQHELERKKTQRCVQCRERKPTTPAHFRVTGGTAKTFFRYAIKCLACEEKGDLSGVFDTVIADMEREYGPYHTWSRDTHREHTRRMHAAVGWPETTAIAPVHTEPDREIKLPVDYSHPLFRAPAHVAHP